MKFLLISLVFILTPFYVISDENQKLEIGLEEKLGNQLPEDIVFIDEFGKPVRLGMLIDKPTIISLVYYRCPGICSPLMSGISQMIDRLDLQAGKDYNVLTVSFNPSEDYLMASEKKKNYFANMQKKIDYSSWRFLTGDSASIAKLTDAIGFRYKKEGEDYIHSALITIVSPSGKIARYLYGTDFLPLDVKLAIAEASEGKTGPTIAKIIRLCYSYDPEGRKYVLNITRIAGAGMIIALAGFLIMLTIKKKNKSDKTGLNNSINGYRNNIQSGG